MKQIVIKKNDANQRIDKYLKKLLCRAPSSMIYKMFRKKDIKINPIWNGNVESAKLNIEYWNKKELLIK